jgi:hypothetical protein
MNEIDGRAVTSGQGSEDGNVNDPFVGFIVCIIERDKVTPAAFRVWLRP